jgi:flagellar biosynthesis protein FlhA
LRKEKMAELVAAARMGFTATHDSEAPVLVTSAGIHRSLRCTVERFRAQTPVLSQGEIHPRARLKTVGSI